MDLSRVRVTNYSDSSRASSTVSSLPGIEEYVERREQLMQQRDGLHETDEWEAILSQAPAFLSDLPAARRAVDDVQRNALTRMLFVQVRIKTSGLWLNSHNPVSHPSSIGAVRCDVCGAEATGVGRALASR